MTYFLDFDRTLFDCDAFVAYRESREGTGSDFAPGELSQFLYPDAAGFLREKGNSAMIITYGDVEFQGAKVKSALAGIPRIAVMYTAGVRKGDYLAPNISMYGSTPVFVDDSSIELENMQERCPNVLLFQMRRGDEPGDGRWPVVHLLSELP